VKLTYEQIVEAIKRPRSADEIQQATRMQREQVLHITGEGYKSWWMEKVAQGFESDKTLARKKHYCRIKTPRIFEGIKKQHFKIFRAKGSVTQFRFKSGKDNKQRIEEALKNVSYGLSMSQYMRIVWFQALYEQFNGFHAVELKPANELKDKNVEEPYLVLYPINEVHDYYIKGNTIQYIILKKEIVKGNDKYEGFRVIDDEKDVVYYKKGDDIIINTIVDQNGNEVEDRFEMKFKEIPFKQTSNRRANVKCEGLRMSPVSVAIPNADSYLSLADDHAICVKLHQHPIFAAYPITCPTCNGSKTEKRRIEGKDGHTEDCFNHVECGTCRGRGMTSFLKTDIAQGISLPMAEEYEEKGFPAAQPPAVYVTPDLESLKEQREEMKEEHDAIEYACLGVTGILARDTQTQVTATKAELDLQPLVDTLSPISENAEDFEAFFIDRFGEILFKDDYDGCYRKYGRTYFLKSEAQLWGDYELAKKAGATDAQLKEILREIIHVKYENDPLAEERAQMLLDSEPLVTKTATELLALTMLVDETTILVKVNFNDLVEKFETEHGPVNMFMAAEKYGKRIEQIQSKLIEYAKQIKPASPSEGDEGDGGSKDVQKKSAKR